MPPEPKVCAACRAPHFNDYDLCAYCSEVRHRALEERLRDDDGKPSWMVIASLAIHPHQGRRFKPAWVIR